MSSEVKLQIKGTALLNKLLNAYTSGYRNIIQVGGMRSGKSYAQLQALVYIAITEPNSKIEVVRESMPVLKATTMLDFTNIVKDLKLYNPNAHNLTDHIYTFDNGSTFQFYSIQDENKLLGRGRDHIYINEITELSLNDWMQIAPRTIKNIWVDYNPSDNEHFIKNIIADEKKTYVIHSTYKDNTFLEQAQIDDIEGLINLDYNYYRVYCLGLAPLSESRVYTHFKKYTDTPTNIIDYAYGIDWGYTHKATLCKVSFTSDNKVYVEELIYEKGLTSSDIIKRMEELSVNKQKKVICDTARPEQIEDLKRAGYNAVGANKSVLEGIDAIKTTELYMHLDSSNYWKEYYTYSWKVDKNGVVQSEVVKNNDEGMDAIRYVINTVGKKRTGSGKWDYEIVFA